jgi:hypothetical protein
MMFTFEKRKTGPLICHPDIPLCAVRTETKEPLKYLAIADFQNPSLFSVF